MKNFSASTKEGGKEKLNFLFILTMNRERE
jgi:hypothetical protein